MTSTRLFLEFVFAAWILTICGCPKSRSVDDQLVARDTTTCSWPVSHQQYKRDSNCVVLTAKGWIHAEENFYDLWVLLDSANMLSIHVDTIIYDSTGTKLLAILGFGYDRTTLLEFYDQYPPCSRLFESRAMIGYLSPETRKWKLYDPDIFVGTAGCDSLELRNGTFDIFFKELPHRQIARTIRNESGKVVSRAEELHYSPLNCAFWTDSPFWRLGYRLPGYYSFEVYQNAGPIYPNSIKKPIEIQYPDSLVKLFEPLDNF
jgi:hypothetical protein